jgi:hypothetical protein
MKFKSLILFEEKRAKTIFFKQIAFSEFFERKEFLKFQLPETIKNVYESLKIYRIQKKSETNTKY